MITDAEEVQLAVAARKALLKAVAVNAGGHAVNGDKAKAYAEAYAVLVEAAPRERSKPEPVGGFA